MFTVGYIPNSGHEQFHEFWDCFNILNKATKLQNNRKQEIIKREEPTWIVKIMLVCVPLSSYPTPESRGEILV